LVQHCQFILSQRTEISRSATKSQAAGSETERHLFGFLELDAEWCHAGAFLDLRAGFRVDFGADVSLPEMYDSASNKSCAPIFRRFDFARSLRPEWIASSSSTVTCFMLVAGVSASTEK